MNKLEELHNCLLNLMVEIDKICRENNINYTLMGGSLLGAIRHNGFIPWDDDMDMGMPYFDYIKLIDVLDKMNHPWLTFDCAFSKDYEEQFMKIYDSRTTFKEQKSNRIKGVFVDVFPLVPAGNTLFSAKCRYYYDTILKMARYNKSNNSHSSFLKMIVYKCVGLFHTKDGLTKKIQKRRARLAKKDYLYSCDPDGNPIGVVKSELFKGYIDHKFETATFMILEKYDAYLSHIFGNYMRLPPKDKQVPGHFEILDLNKSYLERDK